MAQIRKTLEELSQEDAENRIMAVGKEKEREVFNALNNLSDEWIVWMNKFFDEDPKAHGAKACEADCIVYHNQYGLVVIEIKGGIVSCREGHWSQGNRRMDNPYCQAGATAASIRQRLKSNYHLNPRSTHCVAFPDMEDRGTIAKSELDDSSVILRGTLQDPKQLEEFLIQLLERPSAKFGKPWPHTPLEKEDRQLLYSVLDGKDMPTAPEVWKDQNLCRNVVRDFMHIFMDAISANQCIAINGVAGSGKTKMAEWEIGDLLEKGKRVAFVCYNELLADHLKKKEDLQGAEIHAFFRWLDEYFVKKWSKQVKMPQTAEEKSAFYGANGEAMRLLNQFVNELPESEKFDALWIDEGQDLSKEHLDIALMLLKKDGLLRFAYDKVQLVFDWGRENCAVETLLQERSVCRFNLNRSYRSTQNIIQWVRDNAHVDIRSFQEMPEGDAVEVVYFKDNLDLRDKINQKMSILRKEKKILPKDVMMLSLAGENSSGLKEISIENCAIFPNELVLGKANLFSIYRAKGLENNCVFLIDNFKTPDSEEKWQKYRGLLCVAATRARYKLVVFKKKD